ncbi:hypothetical protein [Salinivibrio sp. IB872]|uniref:hypothetical protein n=1 Tax=Salinivibrio sp. IB872 TaxID=1766123 RepID=UPI000984CB8A|nr:hypothetical protein [Salinivibrio sp. IB872]OOF22959.1 hypothetical protein BZJ18_14555 [Salinivibrio sp. IB872]
MYFQQFPVTKCCLCGNSENLTGEHKIKAAALRKEFGKEPLMVGVSGESNRAMKLAQSVKSKHLKFKVRICETCNTSRTQQADREFDRFHGLVAERVKNNQDPLSVFSPELYLEGGDSYLNIFRYFAKLLCCHIAEVDGPIPTTLAEFAISRNSLNRIWLEIKVDPFFSHASSNFGVDQYAAHGGLIVNGDKNTKELNAYRSTITIGPVLYVFHICLETFEKEELQKIYPDFLTLCKAKFEQAKSNQASDWDLAQVGMNTNDA